MLFEKLDNHVNDGNEFDVLPYMNILTLETVAATLFGFEMDVQSNVLDEFCKSMDV